MSQLVARLHLRVGAKLVPEPVLDGPDGLGWIVAEAARLDAVDGGLELQADQVTLCHSHIWDRLDGLLLAWLTALQEIVSGQDAATATFPDARIECEFSRREGGRVGIEYEDVDAVVELKPLLAVVEQAARRLVAMINTAGGDTGDLRRLSDLLRQGQAGAESGTTGPFGGTK